MYVPLLPTQVKDNQDDKSKREERRILANVCVSVIVDGRVAPRSGLASKHFIDTGAGVIDADYRGEVKVLLFNFSEVDFTIQAGDRIAQLVLERVCFPSLPCFVFEICLCWMVLTVADLYARRYGCGGVGGKCSGCWGVWKYGVLISILLRYEIERMIYDDGYLFFFLLLVYTYLYTTAMPSANPLSSTPSPKT